MILWNLLLYSLFTVQASSALDSSSLLKILESTESGLTDVYFEYEGDSKFFRQKDIDALNLRRDGLYDEITGSFCHRRDGACVVDIFHRFAPKYGLTRQTIATLKGKTQSFMRDDAKGKAGGQMGGVLPGRIRRARIIWENIFNL